MQEIHNYLYFVEKVDKLGLKYHLTKDCITVINKHDVLLGKFVTANDALNYVFGYESGIMDASYYKENEPE